MMDDLDFFDSWFDDIEDDLEGGLDGFLSLYSKSGAVFSY